MNPDPPKRTHPQIYGKKCRKILLTVPPRRTILEEFLEAAFPADCHSTAYIMKMIENI